eukprot:7222449-Prymnesium_polylepis.1
MIGVRATPSPSRLEADGPEPVGCVSCGLRTVVRGIEVTSYEFAQFLRRRPEIIAKILSALPSSFVEPFSEGTVAPNNQI